MRYRTSRVGRRHIGVALWRMNRSWSFTKAKPARLMLLQHHIGVELLDARLACLARASSFGWELWYQNKIKMISQRNMKDSQESRYLAPITTRRRLLIALKGNQITFVIQGLLSQYHLCFNLSLGSIFSNKTKDKRTNSNLLRQATPSATNPKSKRRGITRSDLRVWQRSQITWATASSRTRATWLKRRKSSKRYYNIEFKLIKQHFKMHPS